MQERIMRAEEPDWFTSLFFIFCVFLLGTYIGTSTSIVHQTEIINFIKTAKLSSYVNVPYQSNSHIFATYTEQFNLLLIELTAYDAFDFVIQYEISPNSYKYNYVCTNTTDCFTYNYVLDTNYTAMRFIAQMTNNTFNVHGKYYLK